MNPRLLLGLLVLAPLLAQDADAPQPLGTGKPVLGNFDLSKPIDLSPKIGHIHTAALNCEGKPDGLAGKYNGLYYACIDGKDVCSKEKGKIPPQWIADFDARMREFDANMAEFRRKQVEEGRAVSEDPKQNHEAAMDRHRALVAEARSAKAAGRRPNLAAAARRASPSGAHSARPTSAQPRTAATTLIAAAPAASTARPAPTAAAPAAAKAPVAEEAVRALAPGASRAEVLAQLGEPKFRLSGGVERWTYSLTNEGTARLEFQGGKLADVQILPGP